MHAWLASRQSYYARFTQIRQQNSGSGWASFVTPRPTITPELSIIDVQHPLVDDDTVAAASRAAAGGRSRVPRMAPARQRLQATSGRIAPRPHSVIGGAR